MYKWIVLLTSTDYYECLQTIQEVQAKTESEAENIVINDYKNGRKLNPDHETIYVFGPFVSPEDIELHNRINSILQDYGT